MVIDFRIHLTVMILIAASVLHIRFAEASASWPNEPAGSTLISDFAFDAVTGDGWQNGSGSTHIVSDATAPFSPGNVVQMEYPIGFPAGIGPDNIYHSLNGNQTETFMGFWFKFNAGWQQEINSQGSKLAFAISNGQQDSFIMMSGPQGGPYKIITSLESVGVCNGHTGTYGDACNGTRVFVTSALVPVGAWHKIEWYQKFSTCKTCQNGIIRIWVDGVLGGSWTNVNFDSSWPWVQQQLSPTWGGMNNTKTQNDWLRFDHVHLSRPNGASSPADLPPGPPAAPRILNVTAQ